MKSTKLKFLCGLALSAGLFFVSCGKEGSEGPAGPAGPTGATGATGAAGATGATGTANVTYSAWSTPQWNQDNGFIWAEIDAPKITADILSQGSVHVYLNAGSDTEPYIIALPFAGSTSANVPLYIRPAFYLGTIELVANAGIAVPRTDGTGGGKYRYVIVPGGINARTSGSSINWNNYAEVKTYLGLKD